MLGTDADTLVSLPINTINEIGNIYGDLAVLSPVPRDGNVWWLCQCSCGNKRVVRGNRLRKGKATHCGCKAKLRKYSDYVIGQKYNMLTVLEFDHTGTGNHSFYKCQCDCGRIKVIRIDYVVSGSVHSCGCFNKFRVRDYVLRYKRKSPEVALFESIYYSYKKGANKRGLEFSIDEDLFKDLIKGDCHYCGSPPLSEKVLKRKDGDHLYLYNGVDRADNNLGYTKDNSVTCCKKCNIMKLVMDKDDFINHASRICFYQTYKNMN